mgnify:CR=1 FL=1
MFLLVHATAGMIIGQTVNNPSLAFLTGFITHFIFDLIPHGDSRLYKNYKNGEMKKRAITSVTIDGILTILWVLFLSDAVSPEARRAITYGIAGSVLPDLLVGLGETFRNKWLKKFSNLHLIIHNSFVTKIKKDWPWIIGVLFQMTVIIILVGVIKI